MDAIRYVSQLIDALPEEQRIVVRLCDLEHLSFEEIAERTGLTMEVVKRRIARGRWMLRRRVESELRR